MIGISGSIHRSFVFPAKIETAFSFFSDMQRTLNLLPHIDILTQYQPSQYRMVYATTELGIYRVRIFCDLQVILDKDNWRLEIIPIDNFLPISNKAGVYSLSGQGYYRSKSHFIAENDYTRIDYKLELNSELPVPFGIRFMPETVVSSIANSITQLRIVEIADGFIQRSIQSFEHWKNIRKQP